MKLNHAQQKIQRILRDNLYQRSVLSTSGSVEFLRLSHYKTSRMLFSKKLGQSGKHYNFTILLDMSGSMGGDMAINAIRSCQNIIRLLKGIVNLKISVFNNIHFENIDQDEMLSMKTYEQIEQYCEKNFMMVDVTSDYDKETNRYNIRKAKSGDITETQAAYGNTETINIDYEYRKLMGQDGTNVLVVLQDGNLSCDSRYKAEEKSYRFMDREIKKRVDHDFAKRLYKKIGRDIELVSIGILTKEPISFFDNFAYVHNADKIYEVIVKLFERLIS